MDSAGNNWGRINYGANIGLCPVTEMGNMGNWQKSSFCGVMGPRFSLPPEQIFSALMRERLLIELSTAITDALSAEHHMRLTTMQAAEKNIDENLEAMNLEYQQMRQENITTELLDVVSGAEALRTQKRK